MTLRTIKIIPKRGLDWTKSLFMVFDEVYLVLRILNVNNGIWIFPLCIKD